jgi:3-dehydroquinate dehydratase-1
LFLRVGRGTIRILSLMSPRKILESCRKPDGARSGPWVVGTIHSDLCIARARTLKEDDVDLLELRVDHFADRPEVLVRFAEKTSFPLIVTVRARHEGGAVALTTRERSELFLRFLPVAHYVDLELRALPEFAPIVAAARAGKVKIIASHHDFRTTPGAARLASIVRRGRRSGGDIVKIATATATLADLIRLLLLLAKPIQTSLSIMSMGAWGKAGRLLLARAGSTLNYGYLGASQVPGQWEATTFKRRLAELRDESSGHPTQQKKKEVTESPE